MRAALSAIVLTLLPLILMGQGPGAGKELGASYTEGEIELDGVPNEKVWKASQKASEFTQRELKEGDPPTERTEVAVAYDERNLYIFAWCYDSDPSGIINRELKRDFGNGGEDDFQVILDTYNDDRNGFLFITNPNGARRDLQVINNGDAQNANWDGVWDVATQITEEGWMAEFKIPFTTLKYPNNVDEQRWGINFERNIRRKREQVRWTGWSRDMDLEQVEKAGTLTGLDSLRSKDFLEIKPYGVSGVQFDEGEESILNAGGDINYSITPTVRARLTFNTDFAQVESDQQQVNLTRFPLFFPELREFFLEGEDYFDMGFGGNRVIPFYSRRIGLTEDRQPIPILGGARVLGKQGNSTLGGMSIQTAQKDSIPSTNYTVMSLRENVGKQSTVGGMTVNKYANGRWHSTTGVNGRYRNSNVFGDKNLNMRGSYVHSYNSDETFQQDAGAYRAEVTYPNDQLFVFASYQRSPEPFEPEVGLMRRRNFQEAFGMVNIEPRPDPDGPFGWIQKFKFSPGELTYTYFDDTKEMQTFLFQAQPFGFQTRSGESMSFAVARNGEGVRFPFQLGEDITVDAGEYWTTRYTVNASTFSSRILSGGVTFDWGDFFDGRSFQSNYSMNWRTSRFLTIGLDYERNRVYLPDGTFHSDLVGSRLDYAFTPDIFGSVFAQWNDRARLGIMNYRLRWIPKLGTDFFLILNQRYDTSGDRIAVTRTSLIGKLIWRFVV